MIECGLPLTVRLLVLKVAAPELRVSVPIGVVLVPSKKFTVPVGVPVPAVGATVAVNVSD